jgi:hypothetical protein
MIDGVPLCRVKTKIFTAVIADGFVRLRRSGK